MKKYVNGQYVNMTPEEMAEFQRQAAISGALEKSRPMTEAEVLEMLIPQQINILTVDDKTALRMRAFYPDWGAGKEYGTAFKVQRNGKLWRCIQHHTSIVGWEPETAASLWEEINEVHSGELFDPIPYSGSMALTAGLYYIQDGELYLCIRDTVSPVYSPLAELLGLYVEAAA